MIDPKCPLCGALARERLCPQQKETDMTDTYLGKTAAEYCDMWQDEKQIRKRLEFECDELRATKRELEKQAEFLLDLPQLEGVTIWQDQTGEWQSVPHLRYVDAKSKGD